MKIHKQRALFHLHDLRQQAAAASSSPTVWEILSSIIGAESKHHNQMRKEVREAIESIDMNMKSGGGGAFVFNSLH